MPVAPTPICDNKICHQTLPNVPWGGAKLRPFEPTGIKVSGDDDSNNIYFMGRSLEALTQMLRQSPENLVNENLKNDIYYYYNESGIFLLSSSQPLAQGGFWLASSLPRRGHHCLA